MALDEANSVNEDFVAPDDFEQVSRFGFEDISNGTASVSAIELVIESDIKGSAVEAATSSLDGVFTLNLVLYPLSNV